MALSQSGIVSKAKASIYSSGLGEKPSIRQTTGNSSVSGDLVTFDMASGQGAKLREGHVLTSLAATSASDAYSFYVLDVSTDTVTAVNGYDGTAIADATAVGLLEHNAPVSEYMLFDKVDEIIDGYLYPEIYDIINDSFTANLATGEVDADANDEEVLRAWQIVGGRMWQVPARLVDNMPTSQFASGKMIAHDVSVGGTVYYSAVRRVSQANSSGNNLESLIAKGVAALAMETAEASTFWEYAKNDAKERRESSPSQVLWRQFYTAKSLLAEDFSRERVTSFKVNRG